MKKNTFQKNKIPVFTRNGLLPKAILLIAIFMAIAAIFFSLGQSSTNKNLPPPQKPDPSRLLTNPPPVISPSSQKPSVKNGCKKDSECESQTGCLNCQILCEKGKCLATRKEPGNKNTCKNNSDCDRGLQCQDGPKGVASCFIRRCEFNRCQTYSFVE